MATIPKRDMAGVFERIGPFVWRLVIPYPQSGVAARRVRADAGRRTAARNEPPRPGRGSGASDRGGGRRPCADLFGAARASRLRLLAAQDARSCARRLGAVDEEAAARGEPELAVLVVRQSDGLPGQGWWVAGGGSAHGYEGPWEGPKAARFIRELQQRDLRLLGNGGPRRFRLRGGDGPAFQR